MQRIEEWVYDAQSSKMLTFNIASYSLKKALEKQVKKEYMNMGVFAEMQRNINQVVVKKAKKFN